VILAGLQTRADADGVIVWDVSVDSTIMRAHQHAAGARKKGIRRSNHPTPTRAGLNRRITAWVGRGAAGPRRCIWPVSRGADRCRCWSPPGNAVTVRSSPR
jgi:hypothetical protein